MSTALKFDPVDSGAASGAFVDIDGERFYAINDVDRIPPFFISVVSSSDHWLFASSTGGLTAGRVSPDTALFPYITVDKVHESGLHTGPRTLLRVHTDDGEKLWEPFNSQQDTIWRMDRHLYKNVLGNKLCFAEVNHDLGLEFRYTWSTSDEFGFVRSCKLLNQGSQSRRVEILDGLQNVLPAGTPRFTQTNSSNLVDAYKWTELDGETGLAMFTLYSGITDRAEPSESLKANVVFCLGLSEPKVLLSSEQLGRFRRGGAVQTELGRRGIRGAYFVNQLLEVEPGEAACWEFVANIELSQAAVVRLRHRLGNTAEVADAVDASVREGSDRLARIMAMCDGFQETAEENVSVHHYANVLFNVLRGGYFPDHYNVSARDFKRTVRGFNRPVFERHAEFLGSLPESIPFAELLAEVARQGDPQLVRLCQEYLPITFGRRHGDPSRPWNNFAIRLKDRYGNPLLSYEGNWRDIFQNWEALALSFPEFTENMIAKFVNASTMDGYNPYRVTKEGIDWEVEDPEDPWSYIGYWGDHQIIYLQKLLEISRNYHPERLGALLHERIFAYANVPYRIRPFEALLDDPKNTVDYDDALAETIDRLLDEVGHDAKLVLDGNGAVLQVTLLEKLLVPLLSKIGNLVVDGGIWMNTQRPEWNDANNALVGQGLSMVTLYYLRRYVRFLEDLLADEGETFDVSSEIATWLAESASALHRFRPVIDADGVTAANRLELLRELGEAAGRYRAIIYRNGTFSGTATVALSELRGLLTDVQAAIDYSIGNNRREDGLFHAYNLLSLKRDGLDIDTLYPMLEGQVAALSSGAVDPSVAADVLESLFSSSVYRPDQDSFMLYPDRELPSFLEKNRISEADIDSIPLLRRLLDAGNEQIVLRDADGNYRFSAEFTNVGDLDRELAGLPDEFSGDAASGREALRELFEKVFDHQAFTGRSGTMFGFEGLGCIYWHMVSKLLLAVQEVFVTAADAGNDSDTLERLGNLYYRVREGLGFNKTPAEYGAFPTDPYSHTTGHSGARQPGMTGQVKEEILTRFGELGVHVDDGAIRFQPGLLRRREFLGEAGVFRCLSIDGAWQEIGIPENGLAFSLCQVPVVYRLAEDGEESITSLHADGSEAVTAGLSLAAADSAELFGRSGRIRQLTVTFRPERLFGD
ncbi:MAG: hypothetical protein V2I25_10960 [Woeseiaceae bacterium]|nr:hypothetical protein [Woeseiaceae bacterium]